MHMTALREKSLFRLKFPISVLTLEVQFLLWKSGRKFDTYLLEISPRACWVGKAVGRSRDEIWEGPDLQVSVWDLKSCAHLLCCDSARYPISLIPWYITPRNRPVRCCCSRNLHLSFPGWSPYHCRHQWVASVVSSLWIYHLVSLEPTSTVFCQSSQLALKCRSYSQWLMTPFCLCLLIVCSRAMA